MEKILVFTPTYNEAENVGKLYNAIKNLPIESDILYIDDNSPDGTGARIEALIKHDPSVHVIHRSGKLGTGTAFIEAFKFATKGQYDYLITLDADLTHDPAYIPSMLALKEDAHIVIGSRYAAGGKMSGWNTIRLPFTHFWRNMIKYGLGMPFDATGAYRLYDVSILKEEIYASFYSRGFSFQMESIFKFKQHGAIIKEIPIHAKSRIHGESKLNIGIMKEVAFNFFKLLNHRLFGKRIKPVLPRKSAHIPQ